MISRSAKSSCVRCVSLFVRVFVIISLVTLPLPTKAKSAPLQAPLYVNSLLDAAAWAADIYYTNTGDGGLANDYINNRQKHLLYITGSKGLPGLSAHVEKAEAAAMSAKGTIYMDLDDIFSAMEGGGSHSPEGDAGYVTVWIDAGYSLFSASYGDGAIGFNRIEYMPGAPDPSRAGYQLEFLSLCSGVAINGFTKTPDGYQPGTVVTGKLDGLCADLSVDMYSLTMNVTSFEVSYVLLEALFNQAVGAMSGVINTADAAFKLAAATIFMDAFEVTARDDVSFNDLYEIAPHFAAWWQFTSREDGVYNGVDAHMEGVYGGIDLDGDKTPDLAFKDGNTHLVRTRFITTGTEQKNYRVRQASSLPSGWMLTPDDSDVTLSDTSFDIPNVPGNDTIANLPWLVYHNPGVATDAIVEFVLEYQDCILFFCQWKGLDRIDQVFYHTNQIMNQLPPVISYTPPSPTPVLDDRQPYTLQVSVTDANNDPIQTVNLFYATAWGDYVLPMTNIFGSTWQATIPGEHVIADTVTTIIEYWFEANDQWLSTRKPVINSYLLEVNPVVAPPTVQTYTVTGYARTGSGTGISGVTVSIGDLFATTLTNGFYTISGVPAGSHIITPAKYGFTFNPPEIEVNVTGNLSNQIFTGTSNRDQDTWVFPSTPSQMEDSYIYQDDPANNFGSSSTLAVGNAYYNSTYYKYIGLLRFNELKGTLSGMEVYDAKLSVYVSNIYNRTTFWVYGYNNLSYYWYENSVTWNTGVQNANPLNPSQTQTVTSTGWRTFDVTTMTNEYVERYPNYGFVLAPTTLYSSIQNYASINSSENASNTPYLTVKVLTGTPDLAITRIAPVPAPGAEMTYMVGDGITVDFDVYNHGPGGANLTDSCVYLVSDPGNLNNEIATNQSSRLLAGDTDSDTEDYTFTSADLGTRYFVVKANCTNAITETRTDNNTHNYGPFTVIPVNNAPTLTALPDQTIDEDASAPTLIDLWAYASDAETPDDSLAYAISNSPDPLAGVYIAGNRYLAVNPPSSNWNGYVDVVVRVQDAGGKTATDTVRLTVAPVNDPPAILGQIPSQSATINTPIQIDLTPYETDPEESGTNLNWYVTNGSVNVSISGERSDTDVLTFTPAAGFTGNQVVTLHLVDPAGLEDVAPLSLTWITPTAPEMDVRGNSVSIVDGDSTPSTTDHTDFGSANTSSGTVSRTFTVYNTGNADLTLSGSPRVSLGGTNAADFSVTVQPGSPVAAGGSTTFTVVFDPSADGVRTATISISNNDSDENPYNYSIQGTGNNNYDDNYEENDTLSTAYDLSNLERNWLSIINGYGTQADDDWYRIYVNAGYEEVVVDAQFTDSQGDIDIALHDSAGNRLASSTSITDDENIDFVVPTGGAYYYIRVYYGNQGNQYDLWWDDLIVAPEMDVKGNGVSIDDDSSTPSTTNHTDFGSVAVAGGTVSRTFTIYNTGNVNLTLNGSPIVAISGTNATDFTVSIPPTSLVAPAGSTTFTVVFDPSDAGVRTATISIANNDNDESPYDFAIQGSGTTAPVGDVSCDGTLNAVDSLFILQREVGLRPNDSQTCPPPSDGLCLPLCDVNSDGECNSVDALFILQCEVGINNILCPAPDPVRPQGQQPAGTFMLQGGNIIATPGEEFILPVNIQPNGNTLGAITTEISYDPDVLVFLDCPGLNSSAFDLFVCHVDSSQGLLRIAGISTLGITEDVSFGLFHGKAANAPDTGTELNISVETLADSQGYTIPAQTINGRVLVWNYVFRQYLPHIKR